MTKRIFFEYAGEVFSLNSHDNVDIKGVFLFLEPSFKIINYVNEVTCTINLYIGPFDQSWVDKSRPWRMPPILHIDHDGTGGALRIVKYTDEEKIIYREAENDSAGVLLEVSEHNRNWNIIIAENSDLCNKTFSRNIKLLVGYCIYKKKAQVLHASCAIIENKSYVFFGPRGSGKSSFLFRCCTDLKADFKSDDLLICWSEGNDVQLSGWPRRMGISLSAFDRTAVDCLKPFELRRKQSLEENWLNNIGEHLPPNFRKRVLFDVDEFMNIYNANYNDFTEEIVFIMLNFVNEENTFKLMPLSSVVDHNLYTNPNQERHFVDYLNLAPAPLVPGVKHTFYEMCSHNNLFQLSYGPDFFSDFSSSWKMLEKEIIHYAKS